MIENVLSLARAAHPDFVTGAVQFDVGAQLLKIAEYFEDLADDASVWFKCGRRGVGWRTSIQCPPPETYLQKSFSSHPKKILSVLV